MSDYAKMTFVFGREMGARLRDLRKRRKLSLRELASLMDRQGAGSYNQLARLERGAVERPSLNLIADYLRACGVGFENLQDLLGQYTSQPPVARAKADAAVADTLKSLPRPSPGRRSPGSRPTASGCSVSSGRSSTPTGTKSSKHGSTWRCSK